jgi:hypothetical protein
MPPSCDDDSMKARSAVELSELSRRECLEFLGTVEAGRLAVTFKALPVVVPVRIRLDGDEVVITSLLGAEIPLMAGTVVALETGTLGQGTPDEWTVEVHGFLRSEEPVMNRPKEAGSKPRAFRLSTEMTSGWRSTLIGAAIPGPLPIDERSTPQRISSTDGLLVPGRGGHS